MRKLSWIWGVLLFLPVVAPAAPITLTEGFDSLPADWVIKNNSDPLGTTSWFQGNPDIFASQSGPKDSYAAANFLNTGLGGDISTWFLTPVLSVSGDTVLSFYTRTVDSGGEAPFPDRLEVRFSDAGGSTEVGATDTSVGDFDLLLLAINPNLLPVSPPEGYPTEWTQYVIDLSDLGVVGPVDGRFGFRYFVADTLVNGDYIGIDTVSVTAVPEPGTAVVGLGLLGLGLLARARRRA